MANLNRVMLIGRLTRDPEVRTFNNGGKVAKLGFVVNNRRKNPQTSQYEDEPVWLDVECFNRGENGRMADLVADLKKGAPLFIEGHLQLQQWTDKSGEKRSKLVIVADNFQFLAPKGAGDNGAPSAAGPAKSFAPPREDDGGDGGSIPF